MMKTNYHTGSDVSSGYIDIHGLNVCQETLFKFLNLSLFLDIDDLPLAERLEIINILEQLTDLLTQLRIRHTLHPPIKNRWPEKLF